MSARPERAPAAPGPGYRLLRALVRGLLRLGWGLRAEGVARLPAPPYILAPNHGSEIDAVILSAALPVRPSYFASAHLEQFPLLFRIIRPFDPVFVRRGLGDIGSVRATLARLARGDVMAIFPEGHVVQDTPLGPLHEGLAFIALRAGVPIVPVAITGASTMWPLGTRWPKRARLLVRVAPPLRPRPGEEAAALTERIRAALLALLDVPRGARPRAAQSL